MKKIRVQLPFPLLGLHPDSGGEFINWQLFEHCQAHQIAFSRSRPYHKNDNAHVEQKNWTLVRRLIGYQRLDTPRQLAWLNQLYTDLLRPYNNCFQPVMKLVKKESVGQRTLVLFATGPIMAGLWVSAVRSRGPGSAEGLFDSGPAHIAAAVFEELAHGIGHVIMLLRPELHLAVAPLRCQRGDGP